MIATATEWNDKPGTPGTLTRTYFDQGGRTVTAEVTHDPYEGRVWFQAWVTTPARPGLPGGRELITHGSLTIVADAISEAQNNVDAAADSAARRIATAYYQGKLARAMERMEAARAALDAVEFTDYRTLAQRQDELAQLTAELDHVGRMMALAA